MARHLLIFLLAAICVHAQTDDQMRRHIVAEEGYRLEPYLVRGIPHVGLGHRVWGRPRIITPSEAETLFATDLAVARRAARGAIKSFDLQPLDVRVMLVALAYNLGPRGFTRFVDFRAHIDQFDYWRAASDLRKSLWASQLPSRANRYIGILASAGTARLRSSLQIDLDNRALIVQRPALP